MACQYNQQLTGWGGYLLETCRHRADILPALPTYTLYMGQYGTLLGLNVDHLALSLDLDTAAIDGDIDGSA